MHCALFIIAHIDLALFTPILSGAVEVLFLFINFIIFVFQIFVYTSAKKEYADEILDLVDPQKKLVR